MEVSAEDLRERYSQLETLELIELDRDGKLTELATNVLKEVLASRGVQWQ